MIRLERNRVDEQGVAIRPDPEWIGHAATATATAIVERDQHKVTDLYSAPAVKRSLEKLFWNKCVYCEFSPTPGSDWDVEHYRPKARIKEATGHPGYYWLAYSWENLLLSCTHCNQSRRDAGTWDDPTVGAASGKADQFPLEEEAKRARDPETDLVQEAPLLLNPCVDDPEEHIRVGPMGDVIPINDSARGAATIRIVHLDRKRLRDARRDRILGAVELVKALRLAEGTPAHASLRAILDQYTATRAQYAACARWVERDPASFGL